MTFKEIYNDYIDIVSNYLRQRLKDSYLIEDILQETFYVVYKDLDKVKKENSIKSWIITIAHNKMVDKLRKESKEALPLPGKDIDCLLASKLPTDNLLIEETLKKLSGEDRQILYGLYVLQLTYRELAEIMNLPEGSIKSKCYYARKKLKVWLKEVE